MVVIGVKIVKKMILLGIEPRSTDSKSVVLTITPQDLLLFFLIFLELFGTIGTIEIFFTF